MGALRLKSFAKVNLTLKVINLRVDGYHEVESLMQSISLCDELTISAVTPKKVDPKNNKRGSKDMVILCDDPAVPKDDSNLVWKSYELMKTLAMEKISHDVFTAVTVKKDAHKKQITLINQLVTVKIKKRIPVAAGLAGGSSNAAAMIVGLNKMWGLKLTQDELMEIGAMIGSDVPFCIMGGRAICRGRGEIVKTIKTSGKEIYVLVVPHLTISTPWAYKEWDKQNSFSVPLSSAKTKYKNDLEPIVANKHHEISRIKDQLLASGCEWAQMSGSGPSVIGKVKSKAAAQKIIKSFKKNFKTKNSPRFFVVTTIK